MNHVADALLHVISSVRGARARLRHEPGQTLAENSILITVVAVGVTVTAILFFSTNLAGAFDSVTACFSETC